MELSYWQSRWNNNKTGWHLDEVYPLLPKLWPSLQLKAGARLLVPLCGKSLDMQWFLEAGFKITGIDASEKALRDFLETNNHPFTLHHKYGFPVFHSENIELWQGDFQQFPAEKMPPFDAIYDKAALIALPVKKRAAYAQKILQLCEPKTQMLLQTFEYNQHEMNGPPFSVDEGEIRRLYEERFEIALLLQKPKPELLSGFECRGLSSFLTEKIYHLKAKE